MQLYLSTAPGWWIYIKHKSEIQVFTLSVNMLIFVKTKKIYIYLEYQSAAYISNATVYEPMAVASHRQKQLKYISW